MSYARWGSGSSVYVFADAHGGVVCCGCSIDTSTVQVAYTDFFGGRHEVGDPYPFGPTVYFYSAADLTAHLQEHRDAGEPVPDDLFDPDTYEPSDFKEHS